MFTLTHRFRYSKTNIYQQQIANLDSKFYGSITVLVKLPPFHLHQHNFESQKGQKSQLSVTGAEFEEGQISFPQIRMLSKSLLENQSGARIFLVKDAKLKKSHVYSIIHLLNFHKKILSNNLFYNYIFLRFYKSMKFQNWQKGAGRGDKQV